MRFVSFSTKHYNPGAVSGVLWRQSGTPAGRQPVSQPDTAATFPLYFWPRAARGERELQRGHRARLDGSRRTDNRLVDWWWRSIEEQRILTRYYWMEEMNTNNSWSYQWIVAEATSFDARDLWSEKGRIIAHHQSLPMCGGVRDLMAVGKAAANWWIGGIYLKSA